MGEVYRARDTRLNRDVAIKILPQELAANAQFKIRFDREAKTISSLSHPHICALFDIGHQSGVDYLVLELLEGETLADRLTRGPLPIADVIRYGTQIAEALDRAHRSGVTHRDLKPGNIMLTKSGAKLLDFGLARHESSVLGSQSPESATQHKPITQEGTIVGTFQYMSPEQLEGVDTDARSDIFALGAVLYEMATGRRAFEGKTKASLIAQIVSSQPPPVSQLQPLTPPALDHVIQHCLEKDPDNRWQSAKDVAEELKWISGPGAQVQPAGGQRKARERIAWLVAALTTAASIALAILLFRGRAPGEKIVSAIPAPPGTSLVFDTAYAVLSPDGKRLAFVAAGSDGKPFLWVRSLASGTAQLLTATEGAEFPFWSPDSLSLGFFADGKMKKVDAGGGPAERIADALSGRGASWGPNGDILFSPTTGDGLFRVSFQGGEVRPLTKLDITKFDTSHRFPYFLPDGDHFLFYIQGPTTDVPNIFIGSVKGGTAKPLMIADTAAIYAPPGYVLAVRDHALRARPFDTKTLQFTGEAVTIADNVQTSSNLGFGDFSAASDGKLTYSTGGTTRSRVVWVDRTGKEVDSIAAPGDYYDVRLSPDGKRLAMAMDVGGRLNLFLYDIARRVTTRFTFSKMNEWGPVWSPDGESILYMSVEKGQGDLYLKRAIATEPAHLLVADNHRKVPSDWSRDGRTIFYHVVNPNTNWDIAVYSTVDRKSRIFLQTPFAENQARLSPNGRWVAYVSGESGTNEIYVRQFAGEGKWQISTDGATMPVWSNDGQELYYYSRDGKLMSTTVHEGAGFAVDAPKALFPVRLRVFAGITRAQYDISRDGKTFVLNILWRTPESSVPITLVQNWIVRK